MNNTHSCYTWRDAPNVSAQYLALIPQFGGDPTMQNWAESYVRHHAGRCLWDAEFLTNGYQFSTCLNIGGSPYLFEHLLKQLRPNINVISVDLDPNRFPFANKVLDLRILKIDIEQRSKLSSAGLDRYQCVVLCEMFEHLREDLLETVSELRDLLDDDGIFYLTTPNGLSTYAWRNYLTKGRTGPPPVEEWGKLRNIGHMGHVREYSFIEIREILEACGFAVVKYFFRRKFRHRGSWRSRLRNSCEGLISKIIPSLGEEIGIVARKLR